MRRRNILCSAAVVVAVSGVLAFVHHSEHATARHSSRSFHYEVQITNLTRGQIFSPAVVAVHDHRAEPLFTAGEPASEELAAVAEDAIAGPLLDLLEGSPNVKSVGVLEGENGPILPGETATLMIDGSSRARRLSVVGMLVTTNDAFYALNGSRLPLHGAETFSLVAYDAGSEANNELCSHIPGPPCGNAEVRDTGAAEGYVHVHAGVHGGGDLDPAMHDWRNPVGRLTVRRLVRSNAGSR